MGRQQPLRTSAQAILAACALAAAGFSAGCARHAPDVSSIKLASAYVIQPAGPGIIDGYLVIQNSGPADRLLTVSSSAGGTIMLGGPTGQDAPATRTVRALSIPGHSIVRLDPADVHLMISRSGPLRQGTEIMLTLVFARAGTIRIAAQVTNPQTGGNGYLEP
jgi:copper(I)-binding protein